jgi:glyoxylase-like metal-dependent hydrolase (beta-lactamase superfamily II)
MLMGAGGHIGVSYGSDGMLMIDDQFEPLAGKIKAALKTIGPEAPTFLLNTHYHGDHTGANVAFGDDSIIMAHQNVRIRLIDGDKDGKLPKSALPVITYTKQASLHFNDEEIVLLHTPSSHTDGDTVVHFTGSNVIHMGDAFFKDLFPYVDIKAGGSVDGLIDSIEAILEVVSDDTKIIPGHGDGPANKADLIRYLQMLKSTSSTMKQWISEGKSEQEIMDTGLGKEWQSWSWNFISEERWLQTLYSSYR